MDSGFQPQLKIFIAPDTLWDNNGTDELTPHFINLRHPVTGEKSLYLISSTKIYEVIRFHENNSSWFIGDSVQEDGSLYMLTPVDPVFLVLPYLHKASKSNQFRQLEFLLADEDSPETRLLESCDLNNLEYVADVKGYDETKVFRFNEEKALSWLQIKINRLIDSLKEQRVNVSNAAVISTFVQSTKYAAVNQADYTTYAFDLISEYLAEEMADKLKAALGIEDEENNENEAMTSEEPPLKKGRSDGALGPTEDYSTAAIKSATNVKKTEKKTVAQRALSKVNTQGMKSMASFFKAK